jgi:energy-coupling factor transporter ATP-binding protein EcfA2
VSDILAKLQLDHCSLTATCTSDGRLGPVKHLLPKIDAASTTRPLHWVLVASDQSDKETYLASTSNLPSLHTAATLHDAVSTLVKAQNPPNPFRRLRSFTERDARYFGGRDEDIADVKSRISANRFTALVGLSGSGKSSLVFAGVVPQLDPQEWISATCSPRLDKSGALAYAPRLLAARGSNGAPHEEEDLQRAEPSPTPGEGKSLAEHVATLLEGTSEKQLLLIIDQFEELFTVPTEDQQRVFVRQLAALVQGELRCHVVVTMRIEFEAKMLSMPLLARIFAPYTKIVPPMTENQLLEAIRKPVEAVRFYFEPGLDRYIAQELEEAPGALVILEIVLDELFAKRTGALLTHEAYQATGEVREAVARYANQVVLDLEKEEQRPPEEIKKQLQEIFGMLLWNNDGTVKRMTRYVASRAEIGEHNQEMVKKLVNKGLLVTTAEGVQVSHEALIDRWLLMQNWVAEHRRSLQINATVLRWMHNQLTRPMLRVPCFAAVVGALTRPLFARFFGTFLSPPFDSWGSPDVSKPMFYGLVGTLLGSVLLIVTSVQVFLKRSGAIRLRESALFILPGVSWGVLLLLLLSSTNFAAGWGYLLTGTCWGIGIASGTYLGDKVGGHSGDFSQSLGNRIVGAGIGTLSMLLAFVFIIGPFIGYGLERYMADVLPSLVEAHSQVMERAWGEACEQTVSVWAFLGCFYLYLRRVYNARFDENSGLSVSQESY